MVSLILKVVNKLKNKNKVPVKTCENTNIVLNIKKTEVFPVLLNVTKGRQVPPEYYGYTEHYHRGFAQVVVCDDCDATYLYEDFHMVCRSCGCTSKTTCTGKWDYKNRYWLIRGLK